MLQETEKQSLEEFKLAKDAPWHAILQVKYRFGGFAEETFQEWR